MDFAKIFDSFKNGSFNVESLTGLIESENAALKAEADIAPIWETVAGYLEMVMPYMAYIVMALGLVVALFGKKLLPVVKFLGFFAIGFGAGVLYLSPLVDKLFVIPSWITGLVIGVIAAVFFKILYILVVALASGYAMYSVCYTASVLPVVTEFTKGNWIYSLIAGVVAIVIVFLLLKWIEMLGTAFIGANMLVASLNTAFNFMELEFIKSFNTIVFWVAVGIIALVGFIVQVKTRKRY